MRGLEFFVSLGKETCTSAKLVRLFAANLKNFRQFYQTYSNGVVSISYLSGSQLAASDGLNPISSQRVIAATALSRELMVVTRNVRHFEPLGVKVANPFADVI